jgi:transposase
LRSDIKTIIAQLTREERCLLNKSEMARRYNCDPRTIDRQIKIENGELVPKKSSRIYPSKLEAFKPTIINKVDVHGATAVAVYKFIQKKGFDGKYTIVSDFVRAHKSNEIKKATIRFETSPGLQAQVDWKENLTMISKHGEIFKVNIFLIVLGYSRTKFTCLTTNRNQDTLFRCLIESFRYFQGIPQEILFDNMKTVVDRAKSTFRRVEFNGTFKHFADDSGFKPIACRPYRPQTKGKVESLAKLTNRLVVYNEEFEDYDELEKIVQDFNDEINSEISQAILVAPFSRLSKEKEYLNPLPMLDMLLSYVSRQKEYKVTKESMISYKGKKYSVPTKYIDSKVNVRETSDENLLIYYNEDFLVCHPMSNKPFNYKLGHMHEILKSDACKHLCDGDINRFIEDNMLNMDLFLGE